MNALRGIQIPVATPFTQEQSLDLAALEFNLSAWATTGVAGFMVLGTNGEFKGLSDEESRAVVHAAAERKDGKTLIVGAGRESLAETVAFIDSLGPDMQAIDYLSILTPHYFSKQMTGDALGAYYTAVADHSPKPLLLYVAPGYANGVTVPPPVLAALADHPNIAGVKDTSPAMMNDYMLAAGGRKDFTVLAGSLSNIIPELTFGGTGGVVSAANYLPTECAHLTDLWFAGRFEHALTYYLLLQRVVKATGAKYGVAGLKFCMNEVGLRGGVPRLPVQPLPSSAAAEVRETLRRGRDELQRSASEF
jgi:4-hydroxy-2-oxoglutarate aldolase